MAENYNRSSESKRRITVSEKKVAQNSSKTVKNASPSAAKGKGGKSNSSANTPKKVTYTPPSEKIIHQILPFVWFVGALFVLACFILKFVSDEHLMGIIGNAIYGLFFGLFGVGAWLIPPIFVYYGVKWRRFVDERRAKVILKTVLLSLTLLLVSALYQVFCKNSEVYNIANLWKAGIEQLGGGVIGGSLGWLSYMGLKVVGSAIIMIAALLVIVPFIFNQTPLDIAEFIRRKAIQKKEERRRIEEAKRLAEQQRAQNSADGADGDEEREDQNADRAASYAFSNDKKNRLRIVKREKDEKDKLADTETFPDDDENENGVITTADDTVKDNVSIDNKTDTDSTSKTEQTPPSDSTSFKLDDVFDNKARSRMDAGDEDDGVDVFSAKTPAETADESLEGADELVDTEPEDTASRWTPPTLDLLIEDTTSKADLSESIAQTKRKLAETLDDFDIKIKDIGCSVGPTITRYEVVPAAGVRIRAIANLVDDIAMNLATVGVRIEAPIPNKSAVGIEVPNDVQAIVRLRTLIDNEKFVNSSPLTVSLGQDVSGNNVYFDIKKMPHMIIAGTTGSGKSVCMNCIVCSLLYKNSPDAVKIVMIDPKKVEFSVYQRIPHLYCPIINDPKKAAGALASAVAEMERRYTIIEDVGVRDVDSYNAITAKDPDREYLPKLIIVIDELADLMMTAKADVEQFITRIAQKARAVGIHLIIGTQRPSVDVITGLIKANVPSRIACTVKSQVDSRTILDVSGAEKLIGHGDMLFSPIGMSKPMRVQGAYLADEEVLRVVEFIKQNNAPVEYNQAFMASMEAAAENVGEKKSGAALDAADMSEENGDAKFRMAVEIAIREGKVSTSLLQRKLEIGYGRAAKIIDRMEEMGYVSESDGNKPRRILITQQEFYESQINKTSTDTQDE